VKSTTLLSNSMEKSPSWEADSHSVTQLVSKFPAFYGTQMFITVFVRACHWFLSWSRCIQCTHSHPISLKSILIVSSQPHVMPSQRILPFIYSTKTIHAYEGVSKSFRTQSITKQTTINTHWEATQGVLEAKLTRLTHKIAIQLHLVAVLAPGG
jgi:hypothetical protein